MATRKVRLTPKQLGPVQRRFARDLVTQCKQAMVETAMFGVAAVARTTARTKPRPRATGQFEQSWSWQRTKHGAVLGNSSKQAFFVERGRNPGKRPPLDPILEWVRVKRIYRTKAGVLKKHLRGPGQSGRGKAAKAARTAKRDQLERSLAFAVQAKIGKRGTKARWVLKRTMPTLGRYAKRELKAAVARAIENVRP